MATLRTRLPESVNTRVSDAGLTGAIAGVLVLLLWTGISLLPGKSSEIAVAPPTPRAPAIRVPNPKGSPTAAAPPTASPPAAPVLERTPEQPLIAAIQDQVAAITEQYADGLIQSTQANFQSSRLIVTVSNTWYTLNPAQQDQMAREVLRRARSLDFRTLQITNPQNQLLARSPVVGTEMVIMQRQPPDVPASGAADS
ncbi:hypothetical protein [Neosynechococcus sphagnicola]|uniref:hypothetical protein n=1 Tax=Neosynechococcus sphagnicola TaxID=1501145 RepID=UPI0006921793|nr:hypothetical protein [Neosynechococcus sphagnicola]